MIRSMTAFARVTASAKEGGWVIEIRSLNHRYFEFSLKVPLPMAPLENRIRDVVQSQIKRGKVTLGISHNGNGNKNRPMIFDESVVRHYLAAVGKLQKRFKIPGEISVSQLLAIPGLVSFESQAEDSEKDWEKLKRTLERTLRLAILAKEKEGRRLARDIESRIADIQDAVEKIAKHAEESPRRIHQRLSERLRDLLKESYKEDDRFFREAAFLAERSDITEEIVRMKSHLDLFRERLNGSTEVGRELDFLCQEMNREVTTMASKAQLFDVSTEVVFVKGELEKIREQIQNIE